MKSGIPTTNLTQSRRSAYEEEEFGSPFFNDKSCALNGRRMVLVKIFSDSYINSIQAKYIKKGVQVNCRTSRIGLDNFNPEEAMIDFQVLGITLGTTCAAMTQELWLSVTEIKADSVNNARTSNEVKESFESKTSSAERGLDLDVEIGIFQLSVGGSNKEQNGNGHFNGISLNSQSLTANRDDISKSQKSTLTYEGPGAAFLIGYRTRYKIKKKNVAVTYSYICDEGTKPSRKGTINIDEHFFGKVNFQDYHYPFTNITCALPIRSCISEIMVDSVMLSVKSIETKLKMEVRECLQRFA